MTAPEPSDERPRPGTFVRRVNGECVFVGEETWPMPEAEARPTPSGQRRPGAFVERENEADVLVGYERADQLSRGIVITYLPDVDDLGRTSREG